MNLEAGKMRHRVVLQRQTGAVDTTGAETQAWTELATVWAAIEPISGWRSAHEVMQNNQLTATAFTKITVRYFAGLRPKDRVLYGTRIFDILGVSNMEERNFKMELLAKERV